MCSIAIRRTRIACWIPKATNTHTQYAILLFHCNNACTNACGCYIIRTVPVLLLTRLRSVKVNSVVGLRCSGDRMLPAGTPRRATTLAQSQWQWKEKWNGGAFRLHQGKEHGWSNRGHWNWNRVPYLRDHQERSRLQRSERQQFIGSSPYFV